MSATITATGYEKNANRTPIEAPAGGALHGNVTVTLKEPPIGQPNFTNGTTVKVYVGDENRQGTVSRVIGPSKYSIQNLM